MRKIVFIATIEFGFIANAQIVNIPDANFKAWLLSANINNYVASTETPTYIFINGSTKGQVSSYNTIDTNGDGEIQVSEAQQIKYLKIQYANINSLIGIEAFTNLKFLDCLGNQLTSLNISSLTNLIYLDFSNNQLLNSIDVLGLTNLKYLFCEYVGLSSLNIASLANMQELNCTGNQITTLNVSSSINLQRLNCSENQLPSLDVSQNVNLQFLNCSNNQLTSLNVSQNVNLQDLNCSYNQLPSLDVLQNLNLQSLTCVANLLMSLDVTQNVNLYHLNFDLIQFNNLNISQNVNLLSLSCANNQLSNLDITQNLNLNYLECSNNSLNSLDISLHVNLIQLYCSNNQLMTLDVSQNLSLYYLNCSSNQLTSLDVSQNVNLFSLNCESNQFNSLDVSQNVNLDYLNCGSNQLLSLFLKNNGIYSINLNIYNNPNLQYICADEEDVATVQDQINYFGYTSTCHVNSYCSFTPGGTFYTINGNNRFDSDANGCDTNDFAYPNLKFNLTNGTQSGSLIANGAGSYTLPVSAGIHTITPQLENTTYFNVSPTTATVDFPTQASPFTQDFCITPNGVHHDVEVTLFPIGVARPGFDSSYKMVYKNKGNTIQSGMVLFNFDDCHQVTDFVSATPNPDVVSYNELAFNYTNLLPFETREIAVTLNVNSPMETPAVNIGDFLSIIASITPIVDDENITNNTSNLRQIVVGSYDPNDKTCLEGETINPSMIGEYVHYQIRFENTGTYPAQNVVVKDMIDTTKFDIATLQIISTSHNCYTRINGNKVEFIFENINLPFDDATNDGYVVFKIKTLPTLTINSTISNTAEIYFDYNFPIITNTATSTYQVLANQDFDFANEFTLYPNPVKNVLNINAKNGLEIQSLEIYNTLGQLVMAKPNFEQTIDVSSLPTGTYFIKASTEKGSGSVKFIKE